MRREIERKFLVTGNGWREGATASVIRQGYLCADADRSVRIRVSGERGFLTIKGKSVGAVRAEYEYDIPLEDAHDLLDALCAKPLIEKTRHEVRHDGLLWVVDVFEGENAGLVVAEIELEREDQDVTLPDWVGTEVTDDPRYLNANLGSHPYSRWPLDVR